MERTTITRADLAETVFRKVGLSRAESADLLEMVLDEICSAIELGNNVMLSNFGTFQVLNKEERIGRNPKTGEEAKISPRRVISFKASSNLKNRVFNAHRTGKAKSKPKVAEDRIPG